MTNKEKINKIIKENNIKELKMLLNNPEFSPSFNENYSIKKATIEGKTKIVKILLEDPRVDPSSDYSFCFYFSAINDLRDIFLLLLNDHRISPNSNNNEVIIHSFNKKIKFYYEILWKQEKVKNTLKKDNEYVFNKLVSNDIIEKVKNF